MIINIISFRGGRMDKIVVYHQEQVNGPLVDESGRVILPILTHRNDRGRWLQMTLTTAGTRHTIALIVRVKNVSLYATHQRQRS